MSYTYEANCSGVTKYSGSRSVIEAFTRDGRAALKGVSLWTGLHVRLQHLSVAVSVAVAPRAGAALATAHPHVYAADLS